MGFLDFQSYSLWILIAAFLTASAFVWYAGTKLSAYLDTIANETGLGHAFVGMLLLGGITSLPEVATVSTASLTGNAPLAINNVLGSASINVVLLAFADALLGRRALTSVIGQPNPLLQGTLDILLLTVVVTAIATGDVLIFGVGAWATLLVPLYVFALWLSSQYEHRQTWAAHGSRQRQDQRKEGEEAEREQQGDARQEGGSLRSAIVKTCIAALVILVAGYVLARSGDAIAAKTGIGSSFIGLVLVGFATSLPEVSAIYAAVKLERYSMILGDIFGTNLFNVVLIFIADLFYSGPPVLSVVGTFEAVATLLAIMLTCIYLVGLLERRDRTIWRMGYPSFAVILTFFGGLVLLYAVSTGDYGS
jgi:cation:H+ antiporter